MRNRQAWVWPTLLIICLFASISHSQEIQVSVRSGVARPGAYAIPAGSRLSFLIEKSGGYTYNAWPAGTVLTRKSLVEARRAKLLETISRVEAEASKYPGDDGKKRAFFDSLKKPEPTGEMPIRLSHLRLLKNSVQDLTLENGDELDIPTGKTPVTVEGAVRDRDRSSFPHNDNAGYIDYIRMAGGFSDDADRDRVYLVRRGATAVILARKPIEWDAANSRWEFTAFRKKVLPIEPGDIIVVPKKPAAGSWANRINNLPHLLMEIHALTGVRIDTP